MTNIIFLTIRITTPSVDSGNPSECSPMRADEAEDELRPLNCYGGVDESTKTTASVNFEHDLKQITHKISTLGKATNHSLKL